MSDSPQDRAARRALAQHRAVATGLRGLMAVLTLVSYALPQMITAPLPPG